MVYFPRRNKKMKVVAVAKPKKTINKKKPNKSEVFSIVKEAIARNVENKNTATISFRSALGQGTGNAMHWFIFNNFHTTNFGGIGVFNITRGTQDNHRIGSEIKLKRWIIKGHICPQYLGGINNEAIFLQNSFQGYVDIYFGKKLDGSIASKDLFNFLNNGATSEAPNGSENQIFHTVNKYKYKVYYHKRFKVGTSAGTLGQNPSGNMTANNDFNLTRTFGFDVCKYICKNKVLKYDDQTDIPQNVDIQQLAVWGRWTPAVGSLGLTNGLQTYYTVMCQTYAEYEDA
jgi:hypothetical protein